MNLNDDPERLKIEEQKALDKLITKMDKEINKLDQAMKDYVEEAKNADISSDSDSYVKRLLIEKGIKDNDKAREKFLQAREELYEHRILLHTDYAGRQELREVKVGPHKCMLGSEILVMEWTNPICRHFVLDNTSVDYESTVKNRIGKECHAYYKLLVKNHIHLRFTRVTKAINLFPGNLDDELLKLMKDSGFYNEEYLDELISKFNPEDYNPDAAAQIIADEFLEELLERRASQEFKNIIFSIQKKQGEIIGAPMNKNIVVQGCAGSGKSMIMLHRLPILLYDNPNSLSRTNLYIITPSQLYAQLAENMRYQLEISDIKMGTLEEYYDYCISKYPGHKAGEYGRISQTSKVSSESEKYIYSEQMIRDIKSYYDQIVEETEVSLLSACKVLDIKENDIQKENGKTYSQIISTRFLNNQKVLNNNNDVLNVYFKTLINSIEELRGLVSSLRNRKVRVLRELARIIASRVEIISQAQKDLEKLDQVVNVKAYNDRIKTIEESKTIISEHQDIIKEVEEDAGYFDMLNALSDLIEDVTKPYTDLNNDYYMNDTLDIYKAIETSEKYVKDFSALREELLGVEGKYIFNRDSFMQEIKNAVLSVDAIENLDDRFLDYEYYSRIREASDILSKAGSEAVRTAYERIMENIGVQKNQSGSIKALKCSPYIYLQSLYLYQGIPSTSKETLLAIDEAQAIAPEELRLLKDINGDNVLFNLFGDIYQHIEGTKGIDDWGEFNSIIDYDDYELQENYRNASQITEYCNKAFGMNMNAINTPGKGVHEISDSETFRSEMISQLLDNQRAGLAAILVGSDEEARYIQDAYSDYEQKFHDMTDEDFSIHHTRWNIIHIDDAKGLEFSSVIVLAGRMSRNQRYIAYTRALDDLYVYTEEIDTSGYENEQKKDKPKIDDSSESSPRHSLNQTDNKEIGDEVKNFFSKKGLEVVDQRFNGGRLWVIGEKSDIRDIVNEAISLFKISGKYASSKEINNRAGWYTKTNK